MQTGIKSLISAAALAAFAIAIGAAPPAAADSPKLPGIDEVQHPARHQTSGDVELNSSPVVTFPRLYPDFAAKGVYHHGHHH